MDMRPNVRLFGHSLVRKGGSHLSQGNANIFFDERPSVTVLLPARKHNQALAEGSGSRCCGRMYQGYSGVSCGAYIVC